jgi:hypothetical protein
MDATNNCGTFTIINKRSLLCVNNISTMSKIEKALKIIKKNKKEGNIKARKAWYRIGKYLCKGRKIEMHKESKVGARRVYRYYRIGKGDWNGPSPRKFSKMNNEKFQQVLKGREQLKGETLLETGLDITAPTAGDTQEVVTCDNRRDSQDCEPRREAAEEEQVIPKDREPDLQGADDLQQMTAEQFLQACDAWEYNEDTYLNW